MTFVGYMGQCLPIPWMPYAICQSIHDKNYCQVFGNKQFFVEAYPIKKKSDCHLGLDKFIKKYGAPYKITYDGANEKLKEG